MRVCKFGGASLCDAAAFRRVRKIVEQNGDRQIIVPSAPGKRNAEDEKITDLLYACQTAAADGRGFSHLFDRIAARYRQIAGDLGLPAPDEALRAVYGGIRQGASPAWAASRGEWLCARLLSAYLGLPMTDAAEVIRFDRAGRLLEEETQALLQGLTPCVLPGFYGADAAGEIHTFPRGGSDVTGALAAAALNADVYENWKDVPGVFAADPALVSGARPVGEMTYRELRALSRLGAQVLAEDAVAPVRRAGVALHVRSALEPGHPGTRIHAAFGRERAPAALGVTGRTGLTLWRLERMNGGPELARAALEAGLSLERLAADEDALCLLLPGREPLPETLRDGAERCLERRGLAALSVVGEGLSRIDGAARLSHALSAAGLPVLSLHLPPEGLYITAVIPEGEYAAGVRAAYDAFIGT